MAQVLIVGKTLMGKQLCLGGIELGNRRSVRLLPSKGIGHPLDKPIYLGEIWDMTFREVPASEIIPPHTEDVRTIRGRRVRRYAGSALLQILAKHIEARTVEPQDLFDSRIRFTRSARGYVAPRHGLPQYSTGFWRFRLPLLRIPEGNESRYWVFSERGKILLDVKYVGLEEDVPEELSPGTLLRFSLAHAFPDDPQRRCFLQLSGWYM
ncbi:MAG: hypothetical protein F4X02_01665 [Chloroflexi bacterium]|nr:hypothetical protein [Chloroflexota bacterium]